MKNQLKVILDTQVSTLYTRKLQTKPQYTLQDLID